MGFWAGIKYALNRTIGTKNFKPLSTMIEEVNSNVISQKRLAPSDDIIAVWAESRNDYISKNGIIGTRYDYPVTKNTFIPKQDGTIRLIVQNSESHSYTGYVYEGDINSTDISDYIQKASFGIGASQSSSITVTSTADINVFKNKKYKIVIYSSEYYGQSIGRPIKIGAHIVDGLTFDIQQDMA